MVKESFSCARPVELPSHHQTLLLAKPPDLSRSGSYKNDSPVLPVNNIPVISNSSCTAAARQLHFLCLIPDKVIHLHVLLAYAALL